MEKLSKQEKKVLQHLATSDNGECPEWVSPYMFTSCVLHLAHCGFVWYSAEEGGIVVEAHLTHLGRVYLAEKHMPSISINLLVVFSFLSLALSIAALIKAIMK